MALVYAVIGGNFSVTRSGRVAQRNKRYLNMWKLLYVGLIQSELWSEYLKNNMGVELAYSVYLKGLSQ